MKWYANGILVQEVNRKNLFVEKYADFFLLSWRACV